MEWGTSLACSGINHDEVVFVPGICERLAPIVSLSRPNLDHPFAIRCRADACLLSECRDVASIVIAHSARLGVAVLTFSTSGRTAVTIPLLSPMVVVIAASSVERCASSSAVREPVVRWER